MYIAMNRFKVQPGSEAAFEAVWRERDVYIDTLPGFVSFHLLRGPATEEHVLYASHTVWETVEHFRAWTQSEAFRLAHRTAGGNAPLYIGHPVFEGFEAVQALLPRAATATE